MPTITPRRELDTLAMHWQWALDSASDAVEACAFTLPAAEVADDLRSLTRERQWTASLLRETARASGIRPPPWLPPARVHPRLLGLPQRTRACVLDLEGVLTDSGAFHAAAWADAFDDLLLRLAHQGGWQFIRFDPDEDYRAYVEGRPRLEGVHAFLGARGIHLPEGDPTDPPDTATAYGVARRKREVLAHGLREPGVAELPGARRFLRAAGYAHIRRAVVSASELTLPMLELVGLRQLVDAYVDAATIAAASLRSRPAPDVLLAACDTLATDPRATVVLTNSAAGVVAAHSAGMRAIGVATGIQANRLDGLGAERVVPTLAALLDAQLNLTRSVETN